MSQFKLAVVAVLLAGTAVSCAQTGRVTESEKSVQSIREMADQLSIAQTELDKVVASINDLASSDNMQKAFTVYSQSVADIQAARQRAKAQRDSMQANSRSYIAKWQTELETIQDPDVKAALTERKKKVSSSFDTIRFSLDELRAAYQPLIINIVEIRKALAMDLNSSGVNSLESSMDKAKDQAETVKKKVIKVREELEEIAGSLSPTVETK